MADDRFCTVKAILDTEARRIDQRQNEDWHTIKLLREVMKAIVAIPQDDRGNGFLLAVSMAEKAIADTEQ